MPPAKSLWRIQADGPASSPATAGTRPARQARARRGWSPASLRSASSRPAATPAAKYPIQRGKSSYPFQSRSEPSGSGTGAASLTTSSASCTAIAATASHAAARRPRGQSRKTA